MAHKSSRCTGEKSTNSKEASGSRVFWRAVRLHCYYKASQGSYIFPGSLQQELPGAVCTICCGNAHREGGQKEKTHPISYRADSSAPLGTKTKASCFFLKPFHFSPCCWCLLVSAREGFSFQCLTDIGVRTYLGFPTKEKQNEKNSSWNKEQGLPNSSKLCGLLIAWEFLLYYATVLPKKTARCHKRGAASQNGSVGMKGCSCPEQKGTTVVSCKFVQVVARARVTPLQVFVILQLHIQTKSSLCCKNRHMKQSAGLFSDN